MHEHSINDVATVVAQLKAMDRGGKTLPHGCILYTVEQGWETTVVSGDKKTVTADTLLTLEQALRDPEKMIIFIPVDALMTDQDIEKLCQRNGVTKTLFKEVKKA